MIREVLHFLETFERKRWYDMRARVQGIDALNRASQADQPVLQDIRVAALRMLGQTKVLRDTAIRMGLGK